MAKTLEELIKDVRNTTNEFEADFITNDFIIEKINEAQDDLNKELKLQAEETSDLVADQQSYALPTDLKRLECVKVNGERYYPTTFTRLQDSPVLYTYALWNGYIYLYPTPTTAATGGLALYYFRKPARLAKAGDETDVDEEYDQLLTMYAAAKIREKDEEMELYSSMMGQYEQRKAEMIAFDGEEEEEIIIPVEW